MLKNLRRLFVHVGEALHDQLLFPIKIAVNRSGGDSRQLADILDAHTFQTVLPHGLHRC